MGKARIIRLEAAAYSGVVRSLSGLHVHLEEGATTSWVTVTRCGSFTDPRYGKFEITKAMLLSMVQNFEARVFGQDVFIDVAHNPSGGAAGKVLKLSVEGDRLRALVEWTPFGLSAIREKGYRYLSAEYHENWQDNEAGKKHGPVLLGAGLVIRPCIKRLDPIQLSEGDGEVPTFIHPILLQELTQEIKMKFAELLKQLNEKLLSFKLAQVTVDSLVDGAAKALESFTDEAQAKALLASFETTGKQLAEQIGDKPATIQLSMPAGGLTADQVRQLMHDEARRLHEEKVAAEQGRQANVKLLAETVAAGITDAAHAKELSDAVADLVTAEMSTDQVKKLAAVQVAQGQQLAAARKLSAMGFPFHGSARIEVLDDSAKKLHGIIADKLKGTMAFAEGSIKLAETPSPFVERVLGQFDLVHAGALDGEYRMLSGGSGNTADNFFPSAFQREVIREALSDLNILSLVQLNVDPTAQLTTDIPYEVRDTAAIPNDGIVYEGQPIPMSGDTTDKESAFILPMKIGFNITNELMHFSKASPINWDSFARNLASNSRRLKELVARRLANEMQRCSDSYGAIAVTGEAFNSQLTGSNSIIKTANFPIVRPFTPKNMRNEAMGAEQNPIAVVLNGTTLEQYDGTGAQASGTYYRVLSYNLGYIQLVDQAGAAVTPSDTGTNTIGYSKVTNIVKVDTDLGSLTIEKRMNDLLHAVGDQKAMLSGQRFAPTDFLLMSPVLNNQITKAEQFVASLQKAGTGLNGMGDLDAIKTIPAFGTNQPGIDLGDERLLMGPRGLLGYTVAKPFTQIGQPIEMLDPTTNRPLGKKMVYGEEYNAIHMPTPVRKYMTSVLAYSATNR